MIPTAISTGCKPKNPAFSFAMQDWLEAHGLGVYEPQSRHGEASNPSVEWDPGSGGLKWKPITLAHLSALPYGFMFQHYGGYFYGTGDKTTWRTIGWPDPDNPKRRLTQDELTLEQLTGYLKGIRLWLESKNIRKAWIFGDEYPAAAQYGLTPLVEARCIKWTAACLAAGFPVRVAVPGPSQLRFWAARLPAGTCWVLNDKHQPADYAPYLPTGAEVWIYNIRQETLPVLGDRLTAFRASGLLQWNAVPGVPNNQLPLLFDLSGAVPVPTDAAWMLVQQLTRYNGPMLSTDERLTSLERRTTALEAALGAALKAQTGA